MIIDTTAVHRILIIQPRGIGDIVLTSVVFDNLRDDFPDATIDYLIQEPLHRAFLEQPRIRKVLTFSRKDRWSGFRIVRDVRRERYDLVIDFFANPRTALITLLSGARYRAGRPYKARRIAYNLHGPLSSGPGPVHQAERHLAFLDTIGLTHSHTGLHFEPGMANTSFAERFWAQTFAPEDLVVGVLPCGSWASKKCDPEKLAEIADAVAGRYNARILIIWGPDEKEESAVIASSMTHEPVMAPPTSVLEMSAVLAHCDAAIANDSGPMHIAAAVGTPVLAVHGPTNPRRQGPYGETHEAVRFEELDCIGCRKTICPREHECFRDMPLELVMDAFDRLVVKNDLRNDTTSTGERR